MTDNSFQYHPLKPHEIRLLTLSPAGSPDDPIRCSISPASLAASQRPSYDALSYVWGDATSAKKPGNAILLEGRPFPVTANLLSALRHLRPPAAPAAAATAAGGNSSSTGEGGSPLTLWVDAVCINQGDLDERSRQVAMMRDIYASAARVLIWLGEEDEDSDAAFDALPVLIAARRHKRRDEADEEERQRRAALMRRCGSFFFGLADRRVWFSRVWILQELAMARRDPVVACGWKAAPWSVLVRAWRAIAREMLPDLGVMPRREEAQGGVSTGGAGGGGGQAGGDGDEDGEEEEVEILSKIKLDVLDDLRCAQQAKGGDSLRKLLLISRTSEATDPRDRVYALLGLLEKEARDNNTGPGTIAVPIDYRKPAAEVYTDAMAHIFSRGDGPYFLSGIFLPGPSAAAPHVAFLPPTAEQPGLPSWVPDFSRQTAEKASQPSGILFHPPAGVSASGPGADCQNGKRLEGDGGGRTLQVEGLLVDTIEQVIPLGANLDECVGMLPRLEAVVAEAGQRQPSIQRFGPAVTPLIERFKSQEPLWKILISNKSLMSGYDAAPPSYEDMYLELLTQGDDKNKDEQGQQSEYERCLQQGIGERSFFTTESGFAGTCVPDSRAGDVVAILFGAPVPFVLRAQAAARPGESSEAKNGARKVYSLIGASYVGGIMAGEMVDELYCEDLMDSTTFFIQ